MRRKYREVEVLNLKNLADNQNYCISDAGSQLTFVALNLVDRLNIKRQTSGIISISTFAGKELERHIINKAKLGIKTNKQTLQQIIANVTEQLAPKVQVD